MCACEWAAYLVHLVSIGCSVVLTTKAVGIVCNLCECKESIQEIWDCGLVPVLESLVAGDVTSRYYCGGGGGRRARDRAERALEQLVPSRRGIVPELKFPEVDQEVVAVEKEEKLSLRDRFRKAFRLSEKLRSSSGGSDVWSRGLSSSRLKLAFAAPLQRLSRFSSKIKHVGSSRSTEGRKHSMVQLEPRLGGSVLHSDLSPNGVHAIHQQHSLPTWDTSIVHSRGDGMQTDPDVKVRCIICSCACVCVCVCVCGARKILNSAGRLLPGEEQAGLLRKRGASERWTFSLLAFRQGGIGEEGGRGPGGGGGGGGGDRPDCMLLGSAGLRCPGFSGAVRADTAAPQRGNGRRSAC